MLIHFSSTITSLPYQLSPYGAGTLVRSGKKKVRWKRAEGVEGPSPSCTCTVTTSSLLRGGARVTAETGPVSCLQVPTSVIGLGSSQAG